MSVQVVEPGHEFSSHSDLWAIPQPERFALAAKLDWLLNGLLTQAEERVPQHLSPGLVSILKAEEREDLLLSSSSLSAGPLLVSSDKLLPNKFVTLSVYNGSLESWLSEVLKTWEGLGHPSLRLFLPFGVDPQVALKALKHMVPQPPSLIQLVPSQ
jgi:hypothetical protein